MQQRRAVSPLSTLLVLVCCCCTALTTAAVGDFSNANAQQEHHQHRRQQPPVAVVEVPSAAAFERAVAAHPYCVVLYYASWCPHSQLMASSLQTAASVFAGAAHEIAFLQVREQGNDGEHGNTDHGMRRLFDDAGVDSVPALQLLTHRVSTATTTTTTTSSTTHLTHRGGATNATVGGVAVVRHSYEGHHHQQEASGGGGSDRGRGRSRSAAAIVRWIHLVRFGTKHPVISTLDQARSFALLPLPTALGWFCLLYTSPSPRDRG